MLIRYKLKKLITVVTLTLSLNSCKDSGFYEKSRINDIARIPMIDPYELESFDSGNSWFINLKDEKFNAKYFTSQVTDPESIGVSQPYFVFFVSDIFLPNLTNDKEQVWFVVNANAKTVIAFPSSESYHKGLDSLGIEDIKLYDVEEVFKEFDRTGSLPSEWPKSTK